MKLRTLAVVPFLLLTCSTWASCGSAYCVVNTDWGLQSGLQESGQWLLDLRYEFIDQNRLWSGSQKAGADQSGLDTLEQRTQNRNFLATVDHSFDEQWGLRLDVPVVSRVHDHIEDPSGAATPEHWSFTRLGDIRLVGRYNFPSGLGANFGIKLPTGSHTVDNVQGVQAERALQPGTGSTDLILGGYYTSHPHLSGMTWFAQGLYQWAVSTRDGFRPGNSLLLSGGVRTPLAESVTGLVQINYAQRARDSGVNSEPELSGNRLLFLSPGVLVAVSDNAQVYGFLQLPLYRYVNGTQLTADWALVLGVTLRY